MPDPCFGLLGPLRVLGPGGTEIRLESHKQRTVLAVLLLAAGDPVPVDDVAEAVWPTGGPPSAQGTLQTHVSRLRSLLAESGDGRVLEHGASGYRLHVDPDDVDVHRFDACVDRANSESDDRERYALLGRALALWRGPALVDFRYEPFAQTAIVRLEEKRLSTLEARFQLDLDQGRHAVVLPELEALVGLHPLREGLWGQVVVALYRSGRQAEALRAYQRARELLRDELGVDPSPPLRALEQAVLQQSPTLDARQQVDRPLDLAPRSATPAATSRISAVPGDERLRCARLLDRGHRLRRAGEFAAAKEAYAAAAHVAESLELPAQLATAALGLAGPPEDDYFEPLTNPLVTHWLTRVTSVPSVGPMAVARLAIDAMNQLETERSLAMLAHAEREARAAGDDRSLAYVIRAKSRTWFVPEALQSRIESAEELIEIGRRLRDDETETWGHRWLACHLLEAGRVDDVDRELQLLEDAATRLQDPFHEWAVTVRRAGRAMMSGDLTRAERLVDESLVMAGELGSAYTVSASGIMLAVLWFWQGKLDQLSDFLQNMVDGMTSSPAPHAPQYLKVGLPWACMHAGRLDAAREGLEREMMGGVAALRATHPGAGSYLVALAFLGALAARFDDRARMSEVYDALAPFAGQNVTLHAGLTVVTPVEHPLAVIADALGRSDTADRHFESAMTAAEAMGAHAILAWIRLDAGRAWLKRSSAGDQARGGAHVEQARSTAVELGLSLIARQADDACAQQHVSRRS